MCLARELYKSRRYKPQCHDKISRRHSIEHDVRFELYLHGCTVQGSGEEEGDGEHRAVKERGRECRPEEGRGAGTVTGGPPRSSRACASRSRQSAASAGSRAHDSLLEQPWEMGNRGWPGRGRTCAGGVAALTGKEDRELQRVRGELQAADSFAALTGKEELDCLRVAQRRQEARRVSSGKARRLTAASGRRARELGQSADAGTSRWAVAARAGTGTSSGVPF
jgi:hypothetical protein